MKLIDEKGRLFGKLNIIDLLIVLIIIGGLAGVAWKFGFIKKMSTQTAGTKKPIVKIWVKKVSDYTASAIAASNGDNIKDVKTNDTIGKIIAVDVNPAKDVAPDSAGKWVISEVPEQKDVVITMEAASPAVNGNVKLSSVDAKVGVSLIFKGTKFQTTGYVIGVE